MSSIVSHLHPHPAPVGNNCPSCKQPIAGAAKCKLRVEGRNPCPVHYPAPCDCEKPLVGIVEKEDDLYTQQMAQLTQALILASTTTVEDTTATGRSIAAGSTASAPTIAAGTGGTAAAVTDTNMQTQTETQAATVNAYSGSGSSGSYTVTATITATALRAYQEVGLIVTIGGHNFLLNHDTFTTLNVSNGGTLAVTYTMTYS